MNALKKKIFWAVCCSTVSYLALSIHSANDVYAEAVSLPPVAVDPPKRQAAQRPKTQKGARKKAAPLVAAPAQQAEPVPYLTPSTGVLGAPPPPYAGGQVATGGQLGLLGNRSVMDTPFNQTSYTAKLIQDQQARTIGDVMMNDPSVRLVSNAGSNFDVYHIRGFYYENGDLSLNGLYGMAPYYSTAANFVERVEVLKGPSALLNGMPPAGAVGGSINLDHQTGARLSDHAAHDDLPVEGALRHPGRSGAALWRPQRVRRAVQWRLSQRQDGVRQSDRRVRQRRAEPGLSRRARARLGRSRLPDRRSFRAATIHHPPGSIPHIRSATADSRIHLRQAVVVVLEAEGQVRDGAGRGRYHRQHHRLWRVGMAP